MPCSRLAFGRAVAVVLLAVGIAMLFRPWLTSGFDGVIVNDADSRLFAALLVHWDQVFAGRAHWTDPSFFYPVRGTLGLSEAFFLYGAAHAGLTALGFDPFTAIMLVMLGLSIIGFVGFLRLAERHFDIPPPWSAVGAFLFAFANMHVIGLIHAQTYCAMLLPLVCDLALTAWRGPAGWRSIAMAAGAGLLLALSFLTAFQNGWFFGAFLVVFALLHPLVFGPARSFALLRQAAGPKRTVMIACASAFAIGIVPFLWLYLPVLMSGHRRELVEIYSNSPEALDIVNVTAGNWVWGDTLRQLGIAGRPDRTWWEVDYGYTPTVLVLLLVTMIALLRRIAGASAGRDECDRWLLLLAIGTVVFWLLQLDYFGFRPWTALWALLPGGSAIRYTYRSQFVANMFVALVVARGLAVWFEWARQRRAALAVLTAATLLVIVEQANVEWPETVSRRELIQWADAVPPLPDGCRVFYLTPGSSPLELPGWIRQILATLLSEMRGMPTVNGYSTWLPDHWDMEEPDSASYPSAVRDWAERYRIDGMCGLDLERNTWSIGLPR